MKYILQFLLIIIPTILLVAQDSKEITVPLSNSNAKGVLTVDIKTGSVTIKGTTRSDVLVNYTMIDISEDEDHDTHEEKDKDRSGLKKITNNAMDLIIEEDDNQVVIESNSWFRGIDLVIEVPANFDLDITNGMGESIDVDNVNGDLNLSSHLGSVYANNVSGIVNASSYTGEIKVSFKNITAGKDMSFVNYTGNIDISVPATYNANLKMKTGWGDIYSDLDIVTKSSKPEMKKDKESNSFKLMSESWTYATLNGGGPEVSIKSHMGSIYLRKK